MVLPLGLEAEREEAEPPGALHVGSHDGASAVRAAPRSLLGPQNPLLLVADEHQTHSLSSPFCLLRTKLRLISDLFFLRCLIFWEELAVS